MVETKFKLKQGNFNFAINEKFDAGITGIYGPSGAGKTSLLKAISGLIKPQEGVININGNEVFNAENNTNIPVEKRRIGYVFQEGRLFPHLSIEQNLNYGFNKHSPKQLSFDAVVDLLNLRSLLKRKPSAISGGERQRTALGRALLSSPDILLLDEPFSAVDIHLRSQIIPFLLKIHKSIDIPILVVSHDLPDLLKLSSRLCLINNGHCIGHDDYHELLKKETSLKLFASDAIMNAITMTVKAIDPAKGLTILSNNGDESDVRVKCEKSKLTYGIGEELKLFISSDDIALSEKKVEGITIQNQLQGNITDIIKRESTSLCIVDVGFKLVVEITAESQKRMNIEVGSLVWCLFKSVAIDVAG
ncbi:molybdenum ABC transporter ATP-binding protein [Carboxylicivirga sp. N1Y90]|uniref:molybdenum ABC transporter ATP-binding protein n=1 Tax=Carboxylicivirga fragile TaxID=3417571 RepID=UPI003D347BAF|nr:molybdenum ABC transporter ATP-binding protein [Marinilabiliaceae bacterium N1Y90]